MGGILVVGLLVSQLVSTSIQFFLEARRIRIASLHPIDGFLYLVKRLRFGKALLEPIFLVAILIFCQSHLLFSQHMVKDCAVLADFVLLFHCVC